MPPLRKNDEMKVTREICEQTVGTGRRLVIITLAMLDLTEKVLGATLKEIVEYYRRPELNFPIYTAIKEVALNGVKANMKRIVFLKHRLNPHDPGDSAEGLRLLKERIEEGHLEQFARESHALGYMVSVEFVLEPDAFIIEVKNNTGMSEEEDLRIRRKLANSLQYENVAEFFMDEGRSEDDEGAGLGMTLISVMLRTQNIDPHNFVVFSHGETTVGRIVVPIAPGYLTKRQRYARDQEIAAG